MKRFSVGSMFLSYLVAVFVCFSSSLCFLSAQQNPMQLTLKGPIDRWDEAIPLGNGLTGGLLWGEGNQIRLSLDRGGLWDNRPHPITQRDSWDYAHLKQWVAEGNIQAIREHFDDCYNYDMHPTKIPGGRLIIDLPGDVRVGDFKLNLRDAVGSVTLGGKGNVQCLFSATRPVAAIKMPLIDAKIDFLRPKSLDKLDYPSATRGEEGELFWYVQETVADGGYAIVVGKKRTSNTLELVVSMTSSQDGKDPLALGQSNVREALKVGFDQIAHEHLTWWHRWWPGSSVEIPDPSLQLHYHLVKYFHGAASRKHAPPIPLQGVWTADTGGLPPWKGDYHHDLNTQTTYIAYPTAGLFEEGLSFLDYNIDLLPQYRKFAREFYGLDRGAVVPGVADFKGQPLGGWGMYSLSPTHGAWIAQIFRRHWKMTADDTFLREKAWPFTREIAEALLALCQPDDRGYLKLPLSSSPEIHDNTLRAFLRPNSNYDLSMLKMAFETAAEMAGYVKDRDIHRRFAQAAEKLDPLHVDEEGILEFAEADPFQQSHRHHSNMMGIHPFNQLTIEDGPEAQRIIDATLDQVERLGTRAWVGYSFSWFSCIAARAGRAETALKYLKWYEWCTLRNGFHVNGQQRGDQKIVSATYRPFTMEGNFLAMEAVHQMLLQSWREMVRIFPATPAEWKDVRFRDLRAEGGFKVSAVRKDGVTRKVEIEATVDRFLRLRDPFIPEDSEARWSLPISRDGVWLTFELKAGQHLVGTIDR